MEPRPDLLDHVALRVVDRERATDELLRHFDMRVIEQNGRLTLLGPDFGRGKVTLLDAKPGQVPEPRRLVSIVLAEHGAVAPPVVLDTGLVVTFLDVAELGAEDVPRHSLVGLTVRCADPPLAAARLAAEGGLRMQSMQHDVAVLAVGDGAASGQITLTREAWSHLPGGPMLDHIGLRVADAAAWRRHAEDVDADVVDWVEAEHSRALFIAGPEDLVVEFVEHTVPLVG